MTEKITIKGAREHNLKNVSLEIPKNEHVVFTGASGSRKSLLAFDTIFAEGQRGVGWLPNNNRAPDHQALSQPRGVSVFWIGA